MPLLLDELNDLLARIPLLKIYFQLLIPIIVSSPFISLVLFPFYVKVNRKNRKRDEKTAVFPITNYFYKATCVTESCSLIGILLTVIVLLVPLRHKGVAVHWHIWAIIVFVKMNVTMVVNLLTAFLALYRFFLYFFPTIGSFFWFSKKTTKRIFIGVHTVMFALLVLALYSFQASKDQRNKLDEGLQFLQLSLNGLLLLCTFPYFFMILSIRKLTHLSSNIQSRPEQYMKCQIMIILVSKILLIPVLFTIHKPEDSLSIMGAPEFVLRLICETILTPLMIQTAYFLSNKTNFDSLKSSMCPWKTVRKQFYRMDSRVKPTEVVYTVPTKESSL